MRLLASRTGLCASFPSLARAPGQGRAALARVAALALDKRAVTAVEYGIMAALIATALVGAIRPLRIGLAQEFTNIAALMTGDPTMK